MKTEKMTRFLTSINLNPDNFDMEFDALYKDSFAKNMWVIANPTPDLVFNTPPEEMWNKAVRTLGPEYAHWLNVPKYINLN